MLYLLVWATAVRSIAGIQVAKPEEKTLSREIQQEMHQERDGDTVFGGVVYEDKIFNEYGFENITDPETKACLEQFAHLTEKERRDLSEPGLMCLPREDVDFHMKKRATKENQTYPYDRYPATSFPATHAVVGADYSKLRHHVLVIGPESSGTHYMQELIGQAFDVYSNIREFHIHDKVVLSHISQPEGMVCQQYNEVPILDDFGVRPGHYYARLEFQDVTFIGGRFMVDPKSVIRHYKTRGEKVLVVQMVRDPEISMLSKMRGHCNNREKGRLEQEKAFDLMLGVKDQPNVVTICYEEMLEKGTHYIKERLGSALGTELAGKFLQSPANMNKKYSSRGYTKCDHDAKAYMALCPNSPHTRELQRNGCTQEGLWK